MRLKKAITTFLKVYLVKLYKIRNKVTKINIKTYQKSNFAI